MSFLVAAALGVAVLIAVPIAAHLLRRGRAEEREFPPAHLVPVAPPLARKRSRLEDRVLLAIRGLMILALAVLGATPLVRCDRLSVTRSSGASVALSVVIDDSLSMRAGTGRTSKWQRALDGATEVVNSAREGDAVAIVLAGAPARLALAATTDLSAVRRVLAELEATDRATDLEGALQLGRSALKSLPHADKRVLVLSDLAGKFRAEGEPSVWAPLPELRAPFVDCGVVRGEYKGRHVAVTVACSSGDAARDRSLEIVNGEAARDTPDAGANAPKKGEVLATIALEARAGVQTASAALNLAGPLHLEARLTGSDAIASDDRQALVTEISSPLIGVVADPSRTSGATGGAPLLEQALHALGGDVLIRPMALVPDDAKEFAALTALIIDDPAGFSPESRGALTRWVERGGVALALLGPRAENVQLGSTLEPFVRGGVRWESAKGGGIAPESAAWLGPDATGLSELKPKGRARLDGTEYERARVTARWQDGTPFLFERSVERGLLLTASLPVSAEISDFALRPGFLSLLESAIQQAVQRTGARTLAAGQPWPFPASANVEITGPAGRVELSDTVFGGDPSGAAQRVAVPELAGRYRVTIDGESQDRFVLIDPEEITTAPGELAGSMARAAAEQPAPIDASRELGMILLALFGLELVFRAVRTFRASSAAVRSEGAA